MKRTAKTRRHNHPQRSKKFSSKSVSTHVVVAIAISVIAIGVLGYQLFMGSYTPVQVSAETLQYCPSVDLNQSSTVWTQDRDLFNKSYRQKNMLADVNGDGQVNKGDYDHFFLYYRTCKGAKFGANGGMVNTISPVVSLPPNTQLPPTTTSVGGPRLFGSSSPFNKPISATATYTRDTVVGSIRPGMEIWSAPIYRLDKNHNIPAVTANIGSRTASWPIPTTAKPATASDHHMIVIDRKNNKSYEMWNARWSGSNLVTGGMYEFPLDGTGITADPNKRVVAAGFAVSAGMVVLEDFTTTGGAIDPNKAIDHALTMSLHSKFIKNGAYVAPAVGGENGTGSIPLGTQFALSKSVNIDTLSVHPLTKSMAKALQKYGVYVNDGSSAGDYQGKGVGGVRIEPGLCSKVYGKTCDSLISTVQSEIYTIINTYGIYKIN